MLKTTLIALALATAGATAASAQDYRAQYNSNDGYHGYNNYNAPSSDGGLGRYCPPGYYPQSFPNGIGVRCQAQDGRNIYRAPF